MTEQIQILQRRLECFSRRSKSTLDSQKSVFNAFRRKPSLGAPELMIKPRKGKSLSTLNIDDSCFSVASLNISFFDSDVTITEIALLYDPHLKTKLLIHICEI